MKSEDDFFSDKKVRGEWYDISTDEIDNFIKNEYSKFIPNKLSNINYRYQCKKCSKTFNKISHYNVHINRKNPCDLNKDFDPHNKIKELENEILSIKTTSLESKIEYLELKNKMLEIESKNKTLEKDLKIVNLKNQLLKQKNK